MAFPWAAAAGVAGNLLGGIFGSNEANKNRKMQLHLAQNQIQYRVADARAAGIHPLYAMGITPQSYSPVYSDIGQRMADMGQDVSRAILARQSEKERVAEMVAATERANREEERQTARTRAEVDNTNAHTALLQAQLARLTGTPPPPGGNAVEQSVHRTPNPRSQPQAATPVIQSSDGSGREAGEIADVGFYRRPDGGLGITYSRDMKERAEDDLVEQTFWNWRNRAIPYLSGTSPTAPPTSEYPLPRGYLWHWDGSRQAWYPRRVYGRGGRNVRNGSGW